MNTIILLVLALLPCLLLLRFILFMDRTEREPLGLVVKIMTLGALSVLPAAIIEYFLGILPIYGGGPIISSITISFIQVAWIEELAKLGVVLLFAWKSKDFNEENDGIVYVGASALGFAMLENVLYVTSEGIATGIMRALTAVPLHCFTGVLMGYYVGKAKFSGDENQKTRLIWKGFLLAYVIHGIYDSLLFTKTPAALLVLPLVIILVVFGIKVMRKSRVISLTRSEEAAAAAEAAVSPGVPAFTGVPVSPFQVVPPVAAVPGRIVSPPLPQPHIILQATPQKQLWKAIVSRTLLIISGILWALLIIGITTSGRTLEASPWEVIAGGIILTFVPILVGVLLEISYRRRRAFYKAAKETLKDLPAAAAVMTGDGSPPGQSWLIVVGRTLLSLSALFWVTLIIGSLGARDEAPGDVLEALLGGAVISLLPIYMGFAMETSYRARKKTYNELLKTKPAGEIKAIDLRPWPTHHLWRLIVSRLLLLLGSLLCMLCLFDLLSTQTGVIPGQPRSAAGLLIVSLPLLAVGLWLDISYRRHKKDFLAAKNAAPVVPPAHDPKVPISSDEELSEYTSKLKGDREQDRFYYQKRE